MSKIPRLTEKVVDTIIRALRYSGVLADDSSANAIRLVANNATESDLETLAASLNYGGVAGGGTIAGTDDVNVFLDSDNNSGLALNYFRVGHNQSAPPITDEDRELLTLATPAVFASIGQPDRRGPNLTIGPRSTLVTAKNHHGRLSLGYPNGGSTNYVILEGGPEALGLSDAGGRLLVYSGNLAVDVDTDIKFRTTSGSLRGGWEDIKAASTLGSTFHVGDYSSEASLAIETIDDSIVPGLRTHFQLRTTRSDAERKLYIAGSQAGSAAAAIRVAVGGQEGTSWGDPGDTQQDTTLLVVSPAFGADNRATLRLVHRSPSLLANQEIFTIHSEDVSDNAAYMFRISRTGADNDPGVNIYLFDVDNDGNVHADGSYTSPATDVAEWVQVEGTAATYLDGTVLVVNAEGKMSESSAVADPKVIGVKVASTYPALIMGRGNGYDESAAEPLGLVPNKQGSLTSLTFDGDVTTALAGVEYLRVGGYIVHVLPAVYSGGVTTLNFVGGNTVVRYHEGVAILKGLVPEVDKLAMTVVGIVPIRAITTNGSIAPGDRLVSAGGGRCTVAPADAPAGSILGKALSGLADDGSGSKTGIIRGLVNLQ